MIRAPLRQQIWERDKGICGICHEPVSFEDMEIDHVFPRSHGGPDDPENLQAAHEPCNRRKGISCKGYLTTKQAAERLNWSLSTLRSRIGWDGIVVHQEGSGHVLIAEAEVERIERDGWAAYRGDRQRQRSEQIAAYLDERHRIFEAERHPAQGEAPE